MSFKTLLGQEVEILRRENTGTTIRPDYVWSAIAIIDGMMNLLSGREVVRNEGGVVIADYRLYIEFTDITEQDRIKNGADVYEIYSIHNPNNMDRHLEIKMLKTAPGTLDEMGVT